MKFLIRDNFFKSIPKEKMDMVVKNLKYFYSEIEKNSKNLRDIPKGFWIKKLMGVENRFEFRVNNGDRIFFSLTKRGEEEETITFILYSSHDHGVKNTKRAEIQFVKDFEIIKDNFEPSKIEELDKNIFINYNNVITYEVRNDSFFINNKNNRYFYYYLNDEQYKTIVSPAPLFIIGSAGSGKSTITLRKILNIEEHNYLYEFEKIGYFTGNTYLKDNLEEQYNFFRDKKYKQAAQFYTLKEFYRKELGADTRKIINYRKFLDFLNYSFPNRKKLQIEDLNIYFEILGIIKGLMVKEGADNWERDITVPLISLEEYQNLSKKYSVLKKEQKNEIYRIALKYEEWKNESGLYDINDLARKAAGNTEKFDFILVDEVQDLTEVEIYFLFTLCEEPQNILFAGDIHQMVNFNSFSFDRLKNLYYKNNIKYSMSTLVKNYRSSKDIVKLANYLTDLRKKYIGNLGMDDYKEGAILDEGSVVLSHIDYSYIEKFQKDVNAAIIVSDDDERKTFSELSGIKHRIFTVEEIKGLEYRDVICYNLISKNLWAWKKILSGNVKQDQRYRKYFNLFYVGITRARKNLIIMEDNLEKNELLEKIKKFINVEEKEVKKEEIVQNSSFSSKEDWMQEGIKLYKLEKYDEAQYAFEQAEYPSWIAEKEAEIDIENGDYKTALEKIENTGFKKPKVYFYKLIIDNLFEKENYIKSLKYLERFDISYKYFEIKKKISQKIAGNEYSVKEINKLIPYLINKKENILLGDAYFFIKNYDLALKIYRKTANVEGMKKTRREIWTNEFRNVPERDELINGLEEIIGKKDVNTTAKNGETPIFRAMKELNSIDAVRMLMKIGANINEKMKYNGTQLSYLHMAVAIKREDKKWIDFFLDQGIDINIETNNKETPVFLLGLAPKWDMIDYMIEKGADISRPNKYSETLVFHHARNLNVKAFKFFMERTKKEHFEDRNNDGRTVIEMLNEMEKAYESFPTKVRKIVLMKKIYNRIVKKEQKKNDVV